MPLIKIKKCLCPPCNGTSHEWEFSSPRLKEMRIIQAKTGMTLEKFLEAFDTLDPQGLTALVDLLHRRVGVDVRWDDIDLDLEDFDFEDTEEERLLAEAQQAEAGKDEAGPES